MQQKNETSRNVIVWVLIFTVVVVTAIHLHVVFSRSLTDLAIELLAAALAVVLVVASVGVTIHFQSQAETERQYRVCLFERKLEEYKTFLELTAKTDDDNIIEDSEIENIRNQALVLAMLAREDLVTCLADFISNLKITRRLYPGPAENKGSLQRVIISMRADLGVVAVTQRDEKPIERLIRKDEWVNSA